MPKQHIWVAHTDPLHRLFVFASLKLCQQDATLLPLVFDCKPSKMMFNSWFHKNIFKEKQIFKTTSLLSFSWCFFFPILSVVLFCFVFTRGQYVNIPGRKDKIPTEQTKSGLQIIMKCRCGSICQSLVWVIMLYSPPKRSQKNAYLAKRKISPQAS